MGTRKSSKFKLDTLPQNEEKEIKNKLFSSPGLYQLDSGKSIRKQSDSNQLPFKRRFSPLTEDSMTGGGSDDEDQPVQKERQVSFIDIDVTPTKEKHP